MQGAIVQAVIDTNPETMSVDSLVSHYLMSSFLYYQCAPPWVSPWSDRDFDVCVKRLIDHFDEISHPHGDIITLGRLQAGTGFDLQVPTMVKHSARQWVEEARRNKEKGESP